MVRTILLAMLLAGAADVRAQPAAIVPGAGFEVERYAVALRPDLTTTAVSGVETIVVRGTAESVAALGFSANALRIDEATLDGDPVGVASGAEGIVFTLPRAIRRNERATLRFRFAGTPARGVTATPVGLHSGYFACDWMVCLQDAPGDKAQLLLDLFLPQGVTSVGVGRAEAKREVRGGLVRHRWRSTRAYSPYLFAFAAGRFAERSVASAAGTLTYLDGTGSDVELEGLFAASPAIAAFFAGKAGMKLSDRRYVQLLVPGHAAQETAGASLIGKAELERERDDPASAWIVAHEMAHQWWGNLVTCATWRDFWLNEGIATFMVAAWKEHAIGREAYVRELDIARKRVEQVRDIGFDKPLAWGGRYPSLGARRAVQYSKGALFVAALREEIGDDAFWRGLRGFTRRHAGGTVTGRDFQIAMEGASARDLSPMFADWVYAEERSETRRTLDRDGSFTVAREDAPGSKRSEAR